MLDVNNAKDIATRLLWRNSLVLTKHKPEIFIVLGLIGVAKSSIMLYEAAPKARALLKEAQNEIITIQQAKEIYVIEKYSNTDYYKDLGITYSHTSIDLAKLLLPGILLGGLSVGLVWGAHGIMKQRNIALMAAYKALDEGFKNYRRRVIEELGEEKDEQFRYGLQKKVIEIDETDEKGKTKKVKKTVTVTDPNGYSIYAKFFDESSERWNKIPEYSMIFLKAQQNFANDMLHSRGHLFLNEVYDALDIKRTDAGSVVGWCLGEGDNFVDFGIFEANSYNPRPRARAFVNGYEQNILLDFNVDGVIWNLI
jgi:hypothetical protein